MVYNREEAAQRAENARTNIPGTCQIWTRTIFGALSVGDFDGDGDADAVDGWKQSTRKHAGDRHPPRGVPVSFSGGSKGYGHRAVSVGDVNGQALLRSTDMSSLTHSWRPGVVGLVSIADIEQAMNVKYLGWSEDISGVLIPMPPTKKPAVEKKSRGVKIDSALKDLRASKGTGERKILIDRAIETLAALPLIK